MTTDEYYYFEYEIPWSETDHYSVDDRNRDIGYGTEKILEELWKWFRNESYVPIKSPLVLCREGRDRRTNKPTSRVISYGECKKIEPNDSPDLSNWPGSGVVCN